MWEAALPSRLGKAVAASMEDIPHRLFWGFFQQQKLSWEWSVWDPLLVALAKVGGGGWSGEDAETSLKRQTVISCLSSVGAGVSFKFLPCSYQLLKAPELLRDQSANLTCFVH